MTREGTTEGAAEGTTEGTTFADEVRGAVTVRAALLVIGVLALQMLFITSYIGALHSPKARDVKVAVVAPGQTADQLAAELRKLPGGPLDPRTLPDEATARRQMLNRDIDAALVVDPRSARDTLLVASGQGATETQLLLRIFGEVERQQQRSLTVDDVAPASRATPTVSPPSTWSSAGASAAICARRSSRSAPAPGRPTAAGR